MPITVYGVAMSTCTQRVLTTLTEKGLKYELKNVDFAAHEQKVKLKYEIFLFS
jgi:glutathione S-transferase